MTVYDEYFKKKFSSMTESMFTATIAKIIKIDFEYMRCDVQPLYDDEAKPIEDVPFGFMQNDDYLFRFPYKKDDIVFIVFCKEDMAPVLFEDGNREMAAERRFELDDAFVIGGLNRFTKPITAIPEIHDESVLICRKDFKSRIEIDKEGKIIFKTDQDIEFDTEKKLSFKAKNIELSSETLDIETSNVSTVMMDKLNIKATTSIIGQGGEVTFKGDPLRLYGLVTD